MDLKKKGIKEKIHSVKTWLDKAENSYDDNSKAKGELNILMAKAEMQHLEENNKPFVKGYTLLGIPFMFFAIAILAMSLWTKGTPTESNNLVEVNQSEEHIATTWNKGTQENTLFVKELKLDFTPLEEVNEYKAVTLPDVNKKTVEPVLATSNKRKIMNANDVKKAVYEANRSLRGE